MINIGYGIEEVVLWGIFFDDKNVYHNVEDISEDWFLSKFNRDLYIKLRQEKQKGLLYNIISAKERGFTFEQIRLLMTSSDYIPNITHLPNLIDDLKKRYAKIKIKDAKSEDEIIKYSKMLEEKSLDNKNIFSVNSAVDMSKYTEYINDLVNNKVRLYSWGYSKLDENIGKIQEGNFVTIGGRTSTGKTSFMLNLAYNFFIQKYKVLYLTAEMTPFELMNRIVSNYTRIPLFNIMNGRFNNNEERRIIDAFQDLNKFDMTFYENANFKMNEIKDLFRLMNFDVIFVDFLQRFRVSNESETRASGYSDIVSDLKEMALQDKKIIICGSQLTRGVEHRQDEEPLLSDLKESGAIEEVSDKVILLWQKREEMNRDVEREIKLKVAKNRQGRTFVTTFKFKLDTCTFNEN